LSRPYTIRWTASDNIGVTSVGLFLSRDGGMTFPDTIAAQVFGSSSYVWNVTDIDCATCRVKAVARDASANSGADVSNGDFTIIEHDTVPPVVTLLTPNGGEILPCGYAYEVEWNASDNRGVVWTQVLFSANSGISYAETLASGPYDSTFLWTVPNKDFSHCRIKIVCIDADQNRSSDASDADFATSSQTDVVGTASSLPQTLVLFQNQPNPFNPATEIRFGVPEETMVSLQVFSVEGRLIRVLTEGRYPPGYYSAFWDGKDTNGGSVSSGVYLYRLVTEKEALTKKMLMLK
jgi:hypothetical protein